MAHDQADELRQLVLQAAVAGAHGGAAPAPLIVVSGGKGGVGTTTAALNLSMALARQGRRAVFVDADLDHGGNVHLGHDRQQGSVLDVLAGRRSVHEVLSRGPSGIQVLSGAWASNESTEFAAQAQKRFINQLYDLSPHAEVVVVDVGSSRGSLARLFWRSARAVLAVTTTDAASIMECYAAIKVLLPEDCQAPIYTLVNAAPDATSGRDAQSRIAAACQRFLGVQTILAGCVPCWQDPGSNEPVLIYPVRSEAARVLDRASDTLWAQLQLEPGQAPSWPARRSA